MHLPVAATETGTAPTMEKAACLPVNASNSAPRMEKSACLPVNASRSESDGAAKNSEDAECELNNGDLDFLTQLAMLETRSSNVVTIHSITPEQMDELMHKFGPESGRRGKLHQSVAPDTKRRRFARWFSDFFRYFYYDPTV